MISVQVQRKAAMAASSQSIIRAAAQLRQPWRPFKHHAPSTGALGAAGPEKQQQQQQPQHQQHSRPSSTSQAQARKVPVPTSPAAGPDDFQASSSVRLSHLEGMSYAPPGAKEWRQSPEAKLRDAVDRYWIEYHHEELPTRTRKIIADAAAGGKGYIVPEDITRVLANIEKGSTLTLAEARGLCEVWGKKEGETHAASAVPAPPSPGRPSVAMSTDAFIILLEPLKTK